MAIAFSDSEKEIIREKLITAAGDCLGRYGIKKTTIDELVKRAGISKGAFYLFYPSKEAVFFAVFERLQTAIMQELLEGLRGEFQISPEQFSEAIYKVFQKTMESALVEMLVNGELEYLMRKLPLELVEQHHLFDNDIAQLLFARVHFKKEYSSQMVSAALRAVFMSALHRQEVGEEYFDEAVRLIIQGLADQIVEG